MSAQPSTTNGASRSPAPQAASNPSKQPLKTNSVGKTLDGARKQAASPVDAASRKSPAPKAWSQGTNPITQRSNASTPAVNGLPNGTPKNAQSKSQQENGTSAKHATDRLLFLLVNYTGMEVSIFLRSGEHFSGIFSAASTEPNDARVTLKYTKKSTHQTNGTAEQADQYIGEGQDHVTTFNLQDVVDLSINNLYLAASETKAQQAAAPAFRTDVEISGNLNIRERELQPWQPSADTAIDMSLEDSTRPGEWDQFAANEALYNVRSDYDENLYTTAINRSDPDYRRKAAEAERIAREIERSAPVNSHVAEERRMNAEKDGGLDEEERYSGVRRETNITSLLKQGAPNAYVPPSRRPITSQPTVPGAPFDPAIVSVARPSPSTSTNSDSQAALSKQQEQKSQDEAKTEAVSKEAPATTAAPVPALPTVTAPSGEASSTASKPTPASAAPTAATKAVPSINAGKGATEGVERKVLDSFKQFSNTEKLRVQQHQRVQQERQRASARQEKSVKLNDLKKFAENFKLYSRVPDDLIPILAKTKEKQNLIVTKAELQAREKESKVTSAEASPAPAAPVKPDVASTEVNKTQPTSQTRRPEATNEPGSPLSQRQRMAQNSRQNQNVPPRGPGMSHGIPPRPAQQYRAPTANMQMPTPIPPPEVRSPPTGPASREIASPSAAPARLNVKAMEFRPNPSASTFTPTSPTKASPQPAKRPSVSAAAPVKFFARKSEKPLSERTPLNDAFNPVKYMLETAAAEGKTETFAPNGGIPQAYRTPPTWEVAEANKDKTYRDMFAQSPVAAIPPMHTPTNSVMAHAHQLPPHLQNVPPPNRNPGFYPPQPHHPGQHFDEHRMQYASNTPSVQPSPRLPPALAYGPQMHPQMQHFPAGMPPYMSPGMMRPQQFGSPQGPPMGGHMMVQQSSNGPFMNGPMAQQVPMYASPVPGHVQPHFPGHPAPQPGPGFGRGHPMSHQGSQQGHPGQMYMQMPPAGPMMMQQHPGQMQRNFPQGQYPGGPQGQHGYPMQHRAMSNQGYNHNQMTPRQHHAAPQQGPSPGMPPMHTAGPGDEGK
ncbi:hypothetical protein D6D25_02297 [Aureobasidium pullulans]|nr:hypothetical protein D6D25_02297 [Aureobasidium pullulans]